MAVSCREYLQVGKVDGGVGLFSVVVGQKTSIGQSPAKDVVDDQDGGILVGASDIGVVAGNLDLLAGGLAIPLESGLAAV